MFSSAASHHNYIHYCLWVIASEISHPAFSFRSLIFLSMCILFEMLWNDVFICYLILIHCHVHNFERCCKYSGRGSAPDRSALELKTLINKTDSTTLHGSEFVSLRVYSTKTIPQILIFQCIYTISFNACFMVRSCLSQ